MCACNQPWCSACNPSQSYVDFVKKYIKVEPTEAQKAFLKHLQASGQPLTIEQQFNGPTKINGQTLAYGIMDEVVSYAETDQKFTQGMYDALKDEDPQYQALVEATKPEKSDVEKVAGIVAEQLPYGAGISYSVPIEPVTVKPGEQFTIEQAKEPYKPLTKPWSEEGSDPLADVLAWKKKLQNAWYGIDKFGESVNKVTESFQNLVSKALADGIKARDEALLKACKDSLATEYGVLVVESPAKSPSYNAAQFNTETDTLDVGPSWKIGISPKVPVGVVHFYKATYGHSYDDETLALTHAEMVLAVISAGTSEVLSQADSESVEDMKPPTQKPKKKPVFTYDCCAHCEHVDFVEWHAASTTPKVTYKSKPDNHDTKCAQCKAKVQGFQNPEVPSLPFDPAVLAGCTCGMHPHIDGCPAKVPGCQDLCCTPQNKMSPPVKDHMGISVDPYKIEPMNFAYKVEMNYVPIINQPNSFVKITDI